MSLEWPDDLLIMDESSGRAMARYLNIRITGTLGVLLEAKCDGEIPSLEFEMDRLIRDVGFFISDRVRNTFLAEAGGVLEKFFLSGRFRGELCVRFCVRFRVNGVSSRIANFSGMSASEIRSSGVCRSTRRRADGGGSDAAGIASAGGEAWVGYLGEDCGFRG